MKKQITLGALIGYIQIFVNIIITLFYVPLSLKLVGQSEYGLYSLVASIMAYFSVLDMGFGNATIRFISRAKARDNKIEEEKINSLFLLLYSIISFIAIIIGALLIINISKFFSGSLTDIEINKAKILIGISLFTLAVSFPLSVFDSYIMANEKFIFIKILNLLKIILIPLTTIPILLLGYKSIAMVLITSFYTILIHIINMIYCLKKLNMKFSWKKNRLDKSLLKEIIYYSFFIFLNIIVDNIYNNTDQIIIGATIGTVAVSVYAVAIKITSMNQSFSTSISSLFFPKIAKLAEEKNINKLSELFTKVSRIQLYIMLLILSGFIIFGKQFIILWVGEEYLDAYYIILLLISPSIIPLTQNIGISVLQALNKHSFRSIVYIFIAIMNIIISIPLVKLYGGIGAALGTCVATMTGQIIIMNIYYKKIGLDIPKYWKYFLKFAMPIILITLIFKEIIKFMANNWIYLLLGIICYIILYLAYCYLYLNKEEKKIVKSFIKKTN